MKVWVTRAEPGASATAARLRSMGHEPLIAPLLKIQPLAPVIDLESVGALAFTSMNGVAAFAALTPMRDLPVYAVGDATAEAARAAAFANVSSASGAVDDLIELIAATHNAASGMVLWAGAREAADDLPAALEAQGLKARGVAVYEVVETPPSMVSDDETIDAVLIHSPRAARALVAVCAHAHAHADAATAAMVCISDAAALPLRIAGFANVAAADHPDETSLLATLGKLGARV